MNHIKRIWSSIEDAYLNFHVWTIVETHALRQRRAERQRTSDASAKRFGFSTLSGPRETAQAIMALVQRVEKLEAAEQERRGGGK